MRSEDFYFHLPLSKVILNTLDSCFGLVGPRQQYTANQQLQFPRKEYKVSIVQFQQDLNYKLAIVAEKTKKTDQSKIIQNFPQNAHNWRFHRP